MNQWIERDYPFLHPENYMPKSPEIPDVAHVLDRFHRYLPENWKSNWLVASIDEFRCILTRGPIKTQMGIEYSTIDAEQNMLQRMDMTIVPVAQFDANHQGQTFFVHDQIAKGIGKIDETRLTLDNGRTRSADVTRIFFADIQDPQNIDVYENIERVFSNPYESATISIRESFDHRTYGFGPVIHEPRIIECDLPWNADLRFVAPQDQLSTRIKSKFILTNGLETQIETGNPLFNPMNNIFGFFESMINTDQALFKITKSIMFNNLTRTNHSDEGPRVYQK